MKAKVLLSLLVVGITCFHFYFEKKEAQFLELFSGNIEALADKENGSYFCLGAGSLDCQGQKVDYIVGNFSLFE